MNDITYRWLDAEGTPTAASAEDWERVEAILATREWASLNRRVSRVLLAEDAQGAIVGFAVHQMLPYTGPLWVVPSKRGTGVADELAERMFQFLVDVRARGWIATAESPHAEVLMKKYGMHKVDTPVYIMPVNGAGGVS